MKPIKTLVLGVSAVAISFGAFGATTQAFAATEGNSEYVHHVDLTLTGMAAQIHIENKSGSALLKDLDLKVQENSFGIKHEGYVECADDKDVYYAGAKFYFGAISLQNGLVNDNSTLAEGDAFPSNKARDGHNGWNAVEAGEEATLNVPLAQIKNGHPALRVDPLEELEKARQAFNGSDVDFYKQNHELLIKRPVSLVGQCKKNGNSLAGFETQDFNIQIKYKGDASLVDPKLNAQLANNMPNQVQQNPDLPFQLNDVEFQPNMPNYVGKCLPDQDPKIRVNFNVAGGKQGLVDLRIKEEGNQYADYGNFFETSDIAKNPQNGGSLDFSFPLKEMLSQDKYAFMMQLNNKTYSHNMVIEARFKNFDGSNEWSQWKEYGNAVFKHRCTPQIAPQGQNGGIGGYDNGGNAPKPNGTLKVAPVEPQSDLQIKQQEPKKGLLLPAIQKAK